MSEIFKNMLVEQFVAGNELWRIVLFFVILLAGLIVGKIINYFLFLVASRAEKRKEGILSVSLHSIAPVLILVMFVIAFKAGVKFLTLNAGVQNLVDTISGILFVIAIAWLLYRLVDVVDYWLKQLAARTASKLDDMLVPIVRKTLRITIVILALLQIATWLSDKPITSLLAGLGVGGLAIALAAQDTIKNFFGSLMILADKPFELGERIIIEGHDGPVEEIGLRSTRMRTLDGHLVTIPNSELANKTVQNIGKRPYIKRIAKIGVTYDTPHEKVERAVCIIKEILKDHEGMKPEFPPRVYFSEFGDFSLNILVIYWYHPPEYWRYLAFNERVNMEILRRFNEEGIDFAFPTQTVYIAGDTRRPFNISGRLPPLPGEKDSHTS